MIHCSISFFIHLAMIFACLYSCLASGEDVFCISPHGVAAEKMELDICGDMDGDKGFDENLPVKRKTWSKTDIVIPQTNLKCGEYLFLRGGQKDFHWWRLMDKEGNMLGYVHIYLFKTEREARKMLKNRKLSVISLKVKDVWGRDGTCGVFEDMETFPAMLLYAIRGNLGIAIGGPRERDVWDVKLAESIFDFFLDRTSWIPMDEKDLAVALKKEGRDSLKLNGRRKRYIGKSKKQGNWKSGKKIPAMRCLPFVTR